MDKWLKDRLETYDQWLKEGAIDYSAKVVPVEQTISDTQWVLPTSQVTDILRSADLIALGDCVCRARNKRCDKPLEVCLTLNEFGRAYIEKDKARQISYQEAVSRLQTANAAGLVHMSLYRPDHTLYALCSCCSCCCHDLQLMLGHNQAHIVVKSDFIAVQDDEACTHCGICVDRCEFGARTWDDGQVVYDRQLCYGCGLCVTTCPEEVIGMVSNS